MSGYTSREKRLRKKARSKNPETAQRAEKALYRHLRARGLIRIMNRLPAEACRSEHSEYKQYISGAGA